MLFNLMDAVLLRTLTEKSYLKFGQHADFRVGELLKMDKKKYLRWVYFNCSMISFVPELLDTLNIGEEWRINKPGTDPEKGEQFLNNIINNTWEHRKERNMNRKKDYLKKERMQYFSRDKVQFSKSSLQSINQGHKHF